LKLRRERRGSRNHFSPRARLGSEGRLLGGQPLCKLHGVGLFVTAELTRKN
jgi:hypothetical protein